MKYAVICDPETPQALASSTLFDLLGDPSTWKEHHEVRFIGDPDGTDKSWAGLVVEAGGFSVQDDFAGLDDTWIILGPTEEELVVDGTATGAKYLALDEGLAELTVVNEPAEEAPIVPDVPEDAAPVETPKVEVPATPKRRASRKKAEPAPKVEEKAEEPKKVEKPEAEAEVEAKKPLTVESVRAAGQDMYSEAARHAELKEAFDSETQFGEQVFGEMTSVSSSREVPSILRDLISVLIEGADEEQLWQIAASIRGVVRAGPATVTPTVGKVLYPDNYK